MRQLLSSRARWACLLIAAGVIGVLTLTPVTRTGATASFFCLDCGAWIQDGLNNILLFAPFGLGCAMVGLRPLRAAVVSLALSLAVEALQYAVISGRDPSAADLITNSLGGILGAVTWLWKLWWPSRALARRITLPAALLAGLSFGTAGRWFALRVPDGPYFPSLDPVMGPYPAPARLLAATWNGRPLQCCPDRDWRRLQRELADGPVVVRIRAQLLAVPTTTGRLISVWDRRSLPAVVVGVDGRGVWGAFATLGQGAGGRDFAVHAPIAGAWTIGDTLDISLRGERGQWSIGVVHKGAHSDGVLRQSPVLAAFYFLPGFGTVRDPVPFWRWLVSLLPVIVVALWSARARRRLEGWGSAILLAGTAVLVGLPWTFPVTLVAPVAGVLVTFVLTATITARVTLLTSAAPAS